MTRRRLLRDLSSVLILSGALLLADAVVTLAWQEPVTAVVGLIRRAEINHRFQTVPLAGLSRLQRHALSILRSDAGRTSFLARAEDRALRTGDAVGRIAVPRIGISFDIVQGDDDRTLQQGPGHYPDTALPGMGETVAIAGHRTTYLAPFRHIDALRPGDRIVVRMPYARFTYAVQTTRIVRPTDVWVIGNRGYDRLVLSACNPLYSAAQRIVVFARLRSVTPTAAPTQPDSRLVPESPALGRSTNRPAPATGQSSVAPSST